MHDMYRISNSIEFLAPSLPTFFFQGMSFLLFSVHLVPFFPIVHYVVRKKKKKVEKNLPRTMPAIPGLTHSTPCPGEICPCCAAAIAAMRPRKYKTPAAV